MSLRSVSVATLRRELARRERGASKLAKLRDKLASKLADLEAALAGLGVGSDAPRRGRPPGRRPGKMPGRRGPGRPKGSKNKPKHGKRAKNDMTLLEAIVSGVRVGSTVSPAQAGAAAKKAGYKSSSPNFGMMVANALAKAPQFKRKGRGEYVLKGGSPKAAKPGKRGRKARKGRKGKSASVIKKPPTKPPLIASAAEDRR